LNNARSTARHGYDHIKRKRLFKGNPLNSFKSEFLIMIRLIIIEAQFMLQFRASVNSNLTSPWRAAERAFHTIEVEPGL
jgi:hypothetical protein